MEQSRNSESSGRIGSKPKIFTAISHSSGLAAVLGLFITASAYSTDPQSRMVSIGLIIAAGGAILFLATKLVARRRYSQD
ncbi:MAG: hypothetical protein ACE5HC_08665 [Candidatus Binatia bacterium]